MSGWRSACQHPAGANPLLSISPARLDLFSTAPPVERLPVTYSQSPPARAVMQFLRSMKAFVPGFPARALTVCLSHYATPTCPRSPAFTHLRRCHPSQEQSAVPNLDARYCARLAVASACRCVLSDSPRRAFPGQIFQKCSGTQRHRLIGSANTTASRSPAPDHRGSRVRRLSYPASPARLPPPGPGASRFPLCALRHF